MVATDANVAAIIRRGPNRAHQLIKWNFDTDEVIKGQWLMGAQVLTYNCDISPNGRHVLLAMRDFGVGAGRRTERHFGVGDPEHSWTTVSCLPYFTAMGVWFGAQFYGGGGTWINDKEVALKFKQSELDRERCKVPSGLLVRVEGEDENLREWLLAKRGWVLTDERMERRLNSYGNYKNRLVSWTTEKRFSHGTIQVNIYEDPESRKWFRRSRLLGEDAGELITFSQSRFQPRLLDVDHSGRVVYGDRGCLWAWEPEFKSTPKLVADLNDDSFESIEAPASAMTFNPQSCD